MERKYFIYIVACLVLGSFFRFYNIGKYGLLGDEMYALSVANFVAQEGAEQQEAFRKPNSPYFTNIETHEARDLSNFLTAVARRDNGSAALHTFVLHYWIKAFGQSDTALRGLSALFNLLLIGFLFYFVGRHFQNKKLALLAAFLATISPFYIVFSQVARGYTILFFLALLATHLLLVSIHKKRLHWTHVAYGIVCFLLLMSHYSSFVLLAFHATYVFLYFRNFSIILRLAVAALIPLFGLALWLTGPGGHWAFHAIGHSKATYMQEAVIYNDPFIQLTNLKNVLSQLTWVSAMSFLPLEVVFEYVSGLKNWAFTLLNTILALFVIRSSRKTWEKVLSILLMALVLSFVVSQNYLAFIQASFALVLLLWFLFEIKWQVFSKKRLLLWIFPISLLFLAVFAYMDGNTFRMIPRYSGYGYAFGLVCWAAVILKVWSSKDMAVRTIFGVQSILFIFFWVQSLINYYDDHQIRYFHILSEQRMENPYALIADKIESTYAKGDTVIYPSVSFKGSDPGFDMPAYSVQDAQYVNLYLRKGKPEIIQRVDTTETDKVFIKNASGEKRLLFDFENGKYRY